jgi:hypothetical protein
MAVLMKYKPLKEMMRHISIKISLPMASNGGCQTYGKGSLAMS